MKFGKWPPLIVIFIAITVLLAWIKVSQIQKGIAIGKSFGEPMEVVELAIAERSQWQPVVSVTADVVAIQALELTNELSGRVAAIGFSAGDTIRKGQLLLRLDTSEEQAQLAAAQADSELARLALERNQKLARSGVASEEARDQALAQSHAAIASEDRLKAIIGKKTMLAPFDGSAGIFELEVGQYLQSNTLITRLVGDTNKLWLDFYLPQQQATLKLGDLIEATVPQLSGDVFPAQIIARDSWVNPRSGNLRYRALVENRHGKLYPGTVVSISVAVGELQQVTRLPMTAIRYDAFGPNVYILQPAEPGAKAANRALKRQVKLGPQFDQTVVILSGVNVGDRVAGNGAFKLRDGILVKAVNADDSTVIAETVPKPKQLPIESGTTNDDSKPAVEASSFDTPSLHTPSLRAPSIGKPKLVVGD